MNVKKTLSLLALTATLSAGAFAQAAGTNAAAPGTPSGPAPSKIGILDIQNVIAATNEFRRDFEALAKKFDPKKKEIDGLRSELDQLKKQLQDAQNLSDADRATRVRTIEAKEKNLQRIVEDATKDFQDQQQEIIGRIGPKIMDVVDKFSRQNGYGVIVNASAETPGPVLWANEQVNISEAILNAYNAQSGVAAPATNAPSAQRPPAPASKAPATTPAAPKKSGTTPPKQ